MKKRIIYIFSVIIFSIFLFGNISYSASILQGSQGGTGIGSTTSGHVGDCLTVADDSPFSYSLGTCGSGGGGSPASPDTSIQFNNSGSFGGSASNVWDDTNKIQTIGTNGTSPGGLSIFGQGQGSYDGFPAQLSLESDGGPWSIGFRVTGNPNADTVLFAGFNRGFDGITQDGGLQVSTAYGTPLFLDSGGMFIYPSNSTPDTSFAFLVADNGNGDLNTGESQAFKILANGVMVHSAYQVAAPTNYVTELVSTSGVVTRTAFGASASHVFANPIIESSLTGSRAVVSDSSKTLVSSATTDTEIGYVSGVTSAIQTQLNTKVGIVGNDRKTGLSAAQALATYTVPASDTSFEVSANILVTTATVHSFSTTVSYTDEGNTSRTLTLNFSTIAGAITPTIANAGGAQPYEGVPLHIRCKAGTTIIVATTGTFTTVAYNLEERIVQL